MQDLEGPLAKLSPELRFLIAQDLDPISILNLFSISKTWNVAKKSAYLYLCRKKIKRELCTRYNGNDPELFYETCHKFVLKPLERIFFNPETNF